MIGSPPAHRVHLSRNDAVEDEVRPHPQERENHLSGLE